MTTRTILSRSGRIAMLTAGAILLTLTGAASAKSSGGQSHAAPSNVGSKPIKSANSLLKTIPVKKPTDMRPSSDGPTMTPGTGMTRSSGNGLPTLPTTRSGDMRSGTGSERPPANGGMQRPGGTVFY
jgi:hypothetical protein